MKSVFQFTISIALLLNLLACDEANRFAFLQARLSESNIVLDDEIQFADDSFTLELGSTIDFSQSVAVRNASSSTDDITWFINNNDILTQTGSNTFYANEIGSTTLKASVGKLAKTIVVQVIEPRKDLTDVDFYQNLGILTNSSLGQLLFDYNTDLVSLGALTLQELQTHLDCDLQIQSNASDILTIDSNGIYTPLQNGLATITVDCGNDSLSQEISVEAFQTHATPSSQDSDSQNNTPNSSDSTDTTETLLSVTFNLASTYSVGDFVLLKANLEFSTGSVQNVTNNFTTPLGQAAQIQWNVGRGGSINNGVLEFLNYGQVDVALFYGNQSFVDHIDILAEAEEPNSYADRFLGYDDFPGYESWDANTCPVVDFGSNGGYAKHLCPEIIMNQPYGNLHVVSLGSGGVITLELNGYYPVDGEGPDFTIFENPLLATDNNVFAERAQVSVSQNGSTFYDFDCDAFDPTYEYTGCAGVGLVDITADFLDPTASGGDSFDLADLGLSYIRYIQITDLQTCVEGDPTFDSSEGWELCNASTKEGFDLDAIVILNGARE